MPLFWSPFPEGSHTSYIFPLTFYLCFPDIIFVLLPPTCRRLFCFQPSTPCGPSIVMWSKSFLEAPLKHFCQSISISLCHLWISKSACYKGTISHDTYLRYRRATKNKEWNKDMTRYQHLNHRNSRCLDASAKTQTLTAKTMCLHQNQINLPQ